MLKQVVEFINVELYLTPVTRVLTPIILKL